MSAKKFDLFVGCFPGGDVYCNKAVTEHGDYKKIAFIDFKGDLSLSVPADYIPGDVLLRIEHDAEVKKGHFRSAWDRLPDIKKYERLLDSSGAGGLLYSHNLPDDFSLNDKVSFFECVVYGWVPCSPRVAAAIEDYKKSRFYCRGIE